MGKLIFNDIYKNISVQVYNENYIRFINCKKKYLDILFSSWEWECSVYFVCYFQVVWFIFCCDEPISN